MKFIKFTSFADPATGSFRLLGPVTGLRPFRPYRLVMEMFGDRKYCQETALQDSLFCSCGYCGALWDFIDVCGVNGKCQVRMHLQRAVTESHKSAKVSHVLLWTRTAS